MNRQTTIKNAIIEARNKFKRKHGVWPQVIKIRTETTLNIEKQEGAVIGKSLFGMHVDVTEDIAAPFILSGSEATELDTEDIKRRPQ